MSIVVLYRLNAEMYWRRLHSLRFVNRLLKSCKVIIISKTLSVYFIGK